jgi:hypothetical protein
MIHSKTGKLIVGVDCGLGGAVSFLNLETGSVEVWDMPYQLRTSYNGKERRHYLLPDMVRMIKRRRKEICLVCIEEQQPFYCDGVVSSHSTGRGQALIEMLACALRLPYHLIKPQVWKKDFCLGQDKFESIELATTLFPAAADMLRRHLDNDRAEAILIAFWAKLNLLDKLCMVPMLKGESWQPTA